MPESLDVVVIGAGQAGVSLSHELSHAGIEHIVLERGRVGQTWRDRWDSFCLVTPNWSVQLPGPPYGGDSPHGFMAREEVVSYLERYAEAVRAPLREGVEVQGVERNGEAGFLLATSEGELRAQRVVLTTGAYQRPHRPPAAATLPPRPPRLDVDQYRNPAELPPGSVLVVGSGQSGCQVAEELHEAGRDVFLSCGRASWAPRRLGDHDLVWWALETGFLDAPGSSLADPGGRLAAHPTS